MIHEVDEALHGLLTEGPLAGTDVEVAFDAPTKEWASRRNAPTINLFLFDVREDMAYREQGRIEEYDDEGAAIGVHPPPQYYTLSYLVTAWTNHPTDEHRLLSALLAGLAVHPTVPAERLSGTLATLRAPVPMTIAIPPARERGLADIWTALGGALKPSLDLVVTAPLAAWRITGIQRVTEGLRLQVVDADRAGTGAVEARRLRYPTLAEQPAGERAEAPVIPVIPVGAARELGTAGRRRQRRGASRPIVPGGGDDDQGGAG